MDLKIKDVAELLSVSETTIRNWLVEGKIPFYRMEEQFRFSRSEIEDWLNKQANEYETEEQYYGGMDEDSDETSGEEDSEDSEGESEEDLADTEMTDIE